MVCAIKDNTANGVSKMTQEIIIINTVSSSINKARKLGDDTKEIKNDQRGQRARSCECKILLSCDVL